METATDPISRQRAAFHRDLAARSAAYQQAVVVIGAIRLQPAADGWDVVPSANRGSWPVRRIRQAARQVLQLKRVLLRRRAGTARRTPAIIDLDPITVVDVTTNTNTRPVEEP